MTHLSKKLTARRLGGLLGVAVAATLFSAGALALPSESAQAATSAELQSQLDAARADLEIAQSDLEQTEVEIETLSKEIEKNEAELAESRSSLSDMMAENYKYDGNMLSFVLGASSFDELTSRVFYANKVSVSLSTLVGEVVSLQDELENQMTQLEERRAQQEEQTKQQSYRERTVEGADFGLGPVAAVGLRSDASRSHTQEGKNPVNHVEHGATDGNGTDIDSGAEVANDGQIDQ